MKSLKTRLQRGVLPVVGKREKLSRVSTEVGLGATHPAQDGSDDDGRRRAPAFRAERGEAVDVAGGIAVMLAARGTELEAPGQEPGTPATWIARAVRMHRQQFRAAPPIGGFQPRLAGSGLLQPGVGVILVAAREVELTVDRLRHEKAPATAGPVGIIVLVQRHVVDLALLKARGAIGVAQCDRVMLLPAVAAEVGSKESVLGMIGVENLSVEGEGAVTRIVDGGIQPARARDELVELEGEERLVEPICDASILLPQTESEQRRLERRPCLVERSSRLLLERLGGFLE